MKKNSLWLIVIFFILDRLLKFFLPPKSGFFVFKNHLGFLYTKNQGIAFGLDFPNYILIPLIFLILSWLAYLSFKSFKKQQFYQLFCFSLITAGAIGNLTDRLFYGYAIDYIKIFGWPIFNLSDVMIAVGAGLLIYFYFFKYFSTGSSKPAKSSKEAPPPVETWPNLPSK